MDQDLDDAVKQYDQCQLSRHLSAWEWPKHPWIRLHAVYAGQFLGNMFLIVVDAHSKWLEVKPVSAATSTVTIESFRSIFSTHRLPEMLVTDNCTVFSLNYRTAKNNSKQACPAVFRA